nr:hypothetical protein CFP56_63111 [Quercus suber]
MTLIHPSRIAKCELVDERVTWVSSARQEHYSMLCGRCRFDVIRRPQCKQRDLQRKVCFTSDSMRPDHASAHAGDGFTMFELDALAERVYRNDYTQCLRISFLSFNHQSLIHWRCSSPETTITSLLCFLISIHA